MGFYVPMTVYKVSHITTIAALHMFLNIPLNKHNYYMEWKQNCISFCCLHHRKVPSDY